MASVDTVAIVPPPVGRRGNRCNFSFSAVPKKNARSIRVTDLAELRQRNKLACARAVTESEKDSSAPQQDEKQNKGNEMLSNAKTEKLFRQRKVRKFKTKNNKKTKNK